MKKTVAFLLCVAVLGCASCKHSDSSRKALSGGDPSSSVSSAENNGQSGSDSGAEKDPQNGSENGAENDPQGGPDAPAPVKISEENFGSSAFRAAVKQYFDSNSDGFLDAGEIEIIKVLDIQTDEKDFSMKGLSYLTALEELHFSGFSEDGKFATVEDLDVSGNPELQVLEFSYAGLTELDLSHNAKLEVLKIDHNELAELDLTCCPELVDLVCEGNPNLTSLILGNNPKLLYVNCAHNALAQLDLSSCVDLQELNCVSNPLQFLRLSSNLDYRMHEHFRYDAGTPLYWE